MQERTISDNEIPSSRPLLDKETKANARKINFMTIAANFYPVTSAIAMRDTNSERQVTVMNDRAQGGSADLSQNSTIELMQNRRDLEDDNKGLGEALNETDKDEIMNMIMARDKKM